MRTDDGCLWFLLSLYIATDDSRAEPLLWGLEHRLRSVGPTAQA